MFIYASIAYIAPLMGLRISKSHRHIRGPDVFFCIRKHYETDKVEMFGVAPPAYVYRAEFVHNARNNLPL